MVFPAYAADKKEKTIKPSSKPAEIVSSKDTGEDSTAESQSENVSVEADIESTEEAKEVISTIGANETISSKYEDTLLDIARRNDLGFVELRAANPDVDPWLPGEGTAITLPKWNILPDAAQEGIVINLSEMRMYIFEDGKDIRTFPIGIGREGFDTPVGETIVSWKRPNPTWTPTPSMREANPNLPKVVEAGPENPLGTHAVYLGWPNYLMHGTSRPWGIGRRVSSGCIRLYPEDIVQLYDIAQNKMPVQVVDQPVKAAWLDDGFYVEAHPTIDEIEAFEIEGHLDYYQIQSGMLKSVRRAAGPEYANDIEWSKVKKIIQERRGYPIKVLDKKG
jgi:L,D-transpeptidase ErfK/SrfK